MATFTLPTNLASVEGFIGAMYGYAIGSATMAQVNADIVSYGSLNNTLNAYYTAGFGSQTTAAVAASVVANLGIVAGQNGLIASDVAQAVAYVTGVLNAAPANGRGAAILGVVSLFNGLAGTTGPLANFSAAATSWTSNEALAVQYAGSNTSDAALTAAVTTVTQAAATAAAAINSVSLSATTLNYAPTASNNFFTGTGNGTSATFVAGDQIKGGSGTNNSMSISDLVTAAATTVWSPTTLAGVSVSGVQTATFTSSAEAISVNVSATGTQGYTGLATLNVNSATDAAGVDSVTAGAIAVTVNDKPSAAANAVNTVAVTGGSVVTVNVNGNSTDGSLGTISVVGSSTASPTSVTVNQTPTAYNAGSFTAAKGESVVITDYKSNAASTAATTPGVLTTVAIQGLDTQGATITDNSLVNLTVSDTQSSSTVAVTANATYAASLIAASTPTTLNLTVNSNSNGTLTVNDTNNEITTLNVTTGKSTLASAKGYSNLAGTFSGVTSLNINGTGELISTLSTANVTTIAISGTAGLSASLSGLSKLTSITSSSTGTNFNNLTLKTSNAYTNTGSQTDIITETGLTTKAIAGGTATNNEIIYNAVAPGTGNGITGTGGSFSNFTILGTGANTYGTFDLGVIKGITSIEVGGAAASALANATSFVNVPAGTGLTITGASGQAVTYTENDTTGLTDTVNVTLGISSGDTRVTSGISTATTTGITSVSTLTLQDSTPTTAVGLATVNITSYDSTAGNANTITTLADTKLGTLNLSGTGGTIITNLTNDTAASLTINNTSSSTVASTITTLTDASLTSLTFSGTGYSAVTTLSNSGATASTSASTLTITQNDTNTNGVTIGTLTDLGLASMNFAGSGKLTVTTNTADTSSILTLNSTNTNSTAVTLGTLTGSGSAALNTLSFGGTGAITINNFTETGSGLTITDSDTGAVKIGANGSTTAALTASSATSITIINSGTGSLTIGNPIYTDGAGTISTAGGQSLNGTSYYLIDATHGFNQSANNIATITLVNGVAFNMLTSSTAFTTISGSTDNSSVTFRDTGNNAAAATVTLGNGNNLISLNTTSATATITVGNGNNTIEQEGGNNIMAVTLGSGTNYVKFGTGHTGVNTITFSAANAASTTAYTLIAGSGPTALDTITFKYSAIDNTVVNEGLVTSIAAGISGASLYHGYTEFNDGTNTYVWENTGTTANNELVGFVGASHLFLATGVLTVVA